MLIVVSKMKQKYKSPKDPQENDASEEVKKKTIFLSQFCPMGEKRYRNRRKKIGFLSTNKGYHIEIILYLRKCFNIPTDFVSQLLIQTFK